MSRALPWSIPEFHQNSSHLSSELTAQQLQKAREEANQIRERILLEAKSQAELLRKQAVHEGHQFGFEQGKAQAEHETQERLQALKHDFTLEFEQLVRQRDQQWNELLEDLSRRVGELALLACQTLVEAIPEGHLPFQQIKKAIEAISDDQTVLMTVHPSDQTVWPSHLPLEIVKDPSLSPGEFHLRGKAGTVDGSWDKRWNRIRETLVESSHD